MLDVHRREHVDTGGQQLLDVHVALGMAAARRVGVGEFVHQHELRAAGQDGVKVHLGELAAFVVDHAARHDRQIGDQRLGFRPPMRFHHADDHVGPLAPLGPGGAQHFVGLADAGRGAEEQLQAAAAALLRDAQQGLR